MNLSTKICLLFFVFTAACGLNSEDRRNSFYEKAVVALAAGKTEDARLEVQNALRIDPKFAKAYVLMGDIFLATKEWQKAFGSYSKAEELESGLTPAQAGLAKLFFMSGQLDKAQEKASAVLSKEPQQFEMRLIQALLLVRSDKTKDAIPVLENLGSERPDVEDVPLALAEIYLKAGETNAAISTLEKGLQVNRDSLVLHSRLGAIYLAKKFFDKAEEHFQRVVALAPDNGAAQLMLVRFYLETDQKDKACKKLEELVQAQPKEEKYRLALAQIQLSKKDFDASETILRTGISALGEAYDLRLALAELLLNKKQIDAAEKELKTALNLNTEHPRAVQIRLALAKFYALQQKNDAADIEIAEALKRDPQNLDALSLQGRRAMQEAKPKEAIGIFRQVLKLDPAQLEIVPLLARAHLASNERGLAKDVLREALKTKPDFAAARKLLAEIYVLDGSLADAAAELETLNKNNADDLSIPFARSDLALRMNNPKLAEDILRKAKQIHSNRPEIFLRMARFYVQTGRKDLALKEVDQAENIAPTNVEVTEARIAFFLADKKFKDALSYCDRLMESHKNSPYLYDLKGRVFAASGDSEKAEAAFSKALELDPKWLPPYYRIGELYLQRGNLDAGIKKFEEAVQQQPDAIRPRFVLALLNQMNKRTDAARKNYEELLASDPDFMPAVNNLAYMLAEDSKDDSDLQKALSLAQKASERGSAEGLDTLGWVYFRMKNYDQALNVLLEAWEKKSDLPVLAFHIAEVYKAKGELESAKTWIRKAIDVKDNFQERKQAEALAKELGI